MFPILDKRRLSDDVFEFTVAAPRMVKSIKAGQFFIIRPCEGGERVPFTYSDWNAEEGWFKFIFARVGTTTYKLAEYEVGDSFCDIVGPLGNPTELSSGRWVVVGGGVGTAVAYTVARALVEMGAEVTVIVGSRSADLLIMTDEMAALPLADYIVMTDDGSAGEKGLVTQPLDTLCASGEVDQVFAVGPTPMMKFSCLTAMKHGTPVMVSLNPMMVDGTGMCGSCRCTIDGKTKFACIDGPDFDGALVDWDEVMIRQRTYHSDERLSMEAYQAGRSAEDTGEGVPGGGQ